MKTDRELERIIKGFANHRRLQILQLLGKAPELSVDQISTTLGVNFKTASEHIRRLAIAGLVLKRYEGSTVHHKLTPRAVFILKFLRILE
jgi:DNA-binding transcriptional ArsR family regulator